ncbi:MAG: ATP-binding cassette domain-containing protein [Lachnospiraceae bacterium]|nr:ATP-binding cassette domain-containing protein [Lachnospiraceae bacterium]
MSDYIYQFKQVSKVQKLSPISFSIEKGSSYAFIIDNDDTRKTFSDIVCGLECPDDGEISINNKQPYFDGYPYAELGVLLNEPSFINNQDGFKNLKMLSEYSTNVENIQITKVMNFVGLDSLSETKVCNYSCAMYKKLCLAYALIPNADILVINEPFKHLNQYALKDFYTLYTKLRSKYTIIYIAKTDEYLDGLCDNYINI